MSKLIRIVFNNISDFDPVHVFECGQCFRWIPDHAGTEPAAPVTYVGAAGDKAARISFSDGTLVIDATGGDEAFWRDYFDLDTDYGEIKRRLTESEPEIERACGYGSGIRILNQDIFETLISFIISQNNNIPRIRRNIESLCRAYGERIEQSELLFADGEYEEPSADESEGCLYSFPEPESLASSDVCDLAELRLGYRCEYIKASAERFLREGKPESREELLAFHGIGPKVANCIMLFGLRDTAAFPVDTWVKQIMNDMYGFDRDDAKGMQRFAREKFGDLAGYAQQYLFYYYRDRSLNSAV